MSAKEWSRSSVSLGKFPGEADISDWAVVRMEMEDLAREIRVGMVVP